MNETGSSERVEQDRRAFLNVFGKAAIVAPPVVTMLLSTSMSSAAIAASTGASGGIGGVGGDGDPPPRNKPPKHIPNNHGPKVHHPHHNQ